MRAPRRRVLRPTTTTAADLRQQAAAERRRAKLVKERQALHRWMGKLRRAFHAVEASQCRIVRLERGLATNHAS